MKPVCWKIGHHNVRRGNPLRKHYAQKCLSIMQPPETTLCSAMSLSIEMLSRPLEQPLQQSCGLVLGLFCPLPVCFVFILVQALYPCASVWASVGGGEPLFSRSLFLLAPCVVFFLFWFFVPMFSLFCFVVCFVCFLLWCCLLFLFLVAPFLVFFPTIMFLLFLVAPGLFSFGLSCQSSCCVV